MKALQGLLICLLLVIRCAAQGVSAEDWQRRADLASGGNCVKSSMQAARLTLEDANHLFATGDVKTAHSDVDVAVHYVQRSVDCSLHTRKAEKGAEIDLRKLIRRMKDVQQTLDFEDRPHLAQSVLELEKQRDRLLNAMFGAAGGGAEKTP
jgi:hypothetical protein